MTPPLVGKAALITGGGTGLGLAAAKALHADGAYVTLAGRREAVVKAAAAELRERASYVQCDVASEDDVVRAVEVASEPIGGLHIAVNSRLDHLIKLVKAQAFSRGYKAGRRRKSESER